MSTRINTNYEVTREELLAHGISQRTITLAEQTFMRQGQVDFDIQYALAIWDARDRVSLAALIVNNPTERSISFPPGRPYMGLVRSQDLPI